MTDFGPLYLRGRARELAPVYLVARAMAVFARLARTPLWKGRPVRARFWSRRRWSSP